MRAAPGPEASLKTSEKKIRLDVTSSAEMKNSDDFAAAIANMPASDDSLSR